MAQGNTNDKSKKQRPQPLHLQDQSSNVIGNDHSNMSPAESYIAQQSQNKFDLEESKVGSASIPSATSSISHARKMNDWHEQQIRQIYKHEPYRYQYGAPSSSSTKKK